MPPLHEQQPVMEVPRKDNNQKGKGFVQNTLNATLKKMDCLNK